MSLVLTAVPYKAQLKFGASARASAAAQHGVWRIDLAVSCSERPPNWLARSRT